MTDTVKKIDIIIPAYNAWDTLHRCLSSVSMQTSKDLIQVTIINDCDPKGSYQNIIDHFVNEIDIQELILPENKGPGYARQYGIDHTNGKYIMFLDADDTLINSMCVRTLLNYIEEEKASVLYSYFFREDENGSLILYNRPNVFLHGKMYSRSFLSKYQIRFNELRLYEDDYFQSIVDFHVQQLNIPVAHFEEAVMIYHHSQTGLTQSIPQKEYSRVMLPAWIDNSAELIVALNKNNLFDVHRFEMATIVELFLDYNYIKATDVEFLPTITQHIRAFFQNTQLQNQLSELDRHLCEQIYNDMVFNNDLTLIQGHGVRDFVLPVITFEEFVQQFV